MKKYGFCLFLILLLALIISCSGSPTTPSNSTKTTTTTTPIQTTATTSTQPTTTTTTQSTTTTTDMEFIDAPIIRSHQVGGEWADCLTGCHEQGGEDPFPLEGPSAHNDGRWATVDDCKFCHEIPEE